MLTENGTYTSLLLGLLRSSYEKDPESGLSYAGARYYDSDLSIFNSTDPMWHKYPHLTPYHYCANNPIMFVDPDGRRPIPSPDFERSIFGDVYRKLTKNDAYTKMLENYWNSDKYHINYMVESGYNSSHKELYALTKIEEYAKYTHKDEYVYFNNTQTYYLGHFMDGQQKLSEIGKATILAHEGLHSALQLIGLDIGELEDHDDFSQHLSKIKDILSEYSSNNNLNYSERDINDLVHSGLPKDNQILKSYIEKIYGDKKWTYDKKYNHFIERVNEIMFE